MARREGRELTGLIPAHAGKTDVSCPTTGVIAAHPRSRGENLKHGISITHTGGSSPLTRGKLKHPQKASVRPRLIPAHAGKTSAASILGPKVAAHPRSRGENHFARRPFTARRGSSPLTRGKPDRAAGPG